MRTIPLLVPALLLSGCVHVSHFRPASPTQAVEGEPAAGFAEVAGVKAWIRAGDWRGWPDDLEARATPVEVYLENQGTVPLSVKPARFSLLAPGGFRYQALEADQVHRLVSEAWRTAPSVYFHYGFYGAYPWPGFPVRHRHLYPYAWWGWYPAPVVVVPTPPPAGPPPVFEGTLEPGGHVSLLLLFPVPADRLGGFEVAAELVTPAGASVGTLRLSMVRTD